MQRLPSSCTRRRDPAFGRTGAPPPDPRRPAAAAHAGRDAWTPDGRPTRRLRIACRARCTDRHEEVSSPQTAPTPRRDIASKLRGQDGAMAFLFGRQPPKVRPATASHPDPTTEIDGEMFPARRSKIRERMRRRPESRLKYNSRSANHSCSRPAHQPTLPPPPGICRWDPPHPSRAGGPSASTRTRATARARCATSRTPA